MLKFHYPMAEQKHILRLPDQEPQTVFVRRDRRLKKSARWHRQPDGSLLLRIPYRMRKAEIPGLLESVRKQLLNRKKRANHRTDADLQARAEHLNQKYFNGQIHWEAVRWVKPMQTRLGSCTNGGNTDGHIRISEEIKDWPDWVIDYIIAHELTHRLHPDHSKAFWGMLTKAYPQTEQARGFIKGIMFARGRSLEEDV